MNTHPAHRAGRMTAVPMLPASNAALLIDFDNVTLGVRSDLTKELRHLLDSDIIKGKVSVQRAYADWRRYPQYIVPLSESSIDLIFAPAFGTSKKNATDIRLAIDATELVFTRPEIGTFILLSGDSDFSSLVIKLKEYGKYVIGVGIRESASDILIQNCDEYYSYTELAGLTKEVDTPSTQRDPWELVVEAVARMVTNGDVMRADRLKQVMQQLDPNFDESNAGFNRFSKFVQEAGTRGLIALSKMENGQFEVAPVAGATAKAATHAKSAPAAGGGRGRGRGGRGGRGEAPAPTEQAATAAPKTPSAAPAPKESTADAAPTADAAHDRGRRRRRGGRGRSRGGEERAATGAATSASQPTSAPQPAPRVERTELTLAEAFHLLTRALGELPPPVPHETLRSRMAALLGREDPLLVEQHFPKLLRQANDAEVAEVRMLDETHFEVSPHKSDLAMQRRPTAESASTNGNGESVPTATAAATGVRFRSGAGGPKRNGAVRLVGVVTLDEPAKVAAATPPPATESTPAKAPKKSARKSTATTAKSGKSAKAAKTVKAAKPTATPARSAAKKSSAKVATPKKAAKKAAKKATKKSAT